MTPLFGSQAGKPPPTEPTALARFGGLEIVARLVVEGYMIGLHKSPFKGTSVEFVEHRQYYPGDEIRHIDWRAYGKTGRYYVKEFEDETNVRCFLLVDGSGSMAFADSTLSKFDYARYLAASLGYLLLSQRDAAGLLTFDSQVRDSIEPSANPRSFQRIVEALEAREPGGETGLARVLDQVVPRFKRRSLVVIISDCFDRLDPLTTALKRLRHARHEVILFQIVAPEEAEFPFSRPTQFRNLERLGHKILVNPHRLRAHYLKRYQHFIGELERRCGSIGVDYQRLTTTQPYHVALGSYLQARARQKRKQL